MDCAEEVAALKHDLGPLVGGDENLTFDILNAKMGVVSEISNVEIIQSVARAGMHAEVWSEKRSDGMARRELWARKGRLFLTGTSGLFLLSGFLANAVTAGGVVEAFGSEGMGVGHEVPMFSRVLYALGIVCGAWQVLPRAWLALRRFRPDMNLLLMIAVGGAIAIGEWLEAATVAFLFAVALTLESWCIGRARKAIAALMQLAPTTVHIRNDGGEAEVLLAEVAVGSTFVVRPGERIGLDGKVLTGASHINQAPITGESVPTAKAPGDMVYAGTINGDGILEVESTKPAADTTLAHIVRMVVEAQSRRAPIEQWVETFARVYTPVVIGVAVLIFLLPPMLFAQPWSEWLYRALVLLVIGCPCALVISTPVTIVAGLTASARNGVLIKGGIYLEAPSRIKALALDKTGTLTQGKPSVVEIVPLPGHDERELIELAAALEVNSDHPIARAIVSHAKVKGVEIRPAEKFRIVKGKGAIGWIAGREYWLGSHRYLEERGQETRDLHERLERMSESGRTVVVIGNEVRVCGVLAIADSIRPEAKDVVERLHRFGIERVVMLTGDNLGTAEAIARDAGIDEVKAELLPQDKVAAIEDLMNQYGEVGMVGDGVNDAPALGRATVGIAMGTIGSDAAIETADIALMADDISKLPWLIEHSRRTLTIIRQNIVFSLAIKAIFVALTVFGLASLWSAIAADMGASLVVTFNGLRLLRKRTTALAEGS